mmetsp:Transcript_28440/g.91677  ORF Transcript_28440/g.91677 Transcript_28440/m.91677 type:complete len:106 (-) Transcript_28440:419-736(-)
MSAEEELKANWLRLEEARRRLVTYEAEALRLSEREDAAHEALVAENEDLRRRLYETHRVRPAPSTFGAYDDVAKQLRTALARLEMSTQREKQWQQIYLNVAARPS